MTSCNNAFQEFYYMEDLNQLSRLTGCYGNQQGETSKYVAVSRVL